MDPEPLVRGRSQIADGSSADRCYLYAAGREMVLGDTFGRGSTTLVIHPPGFSSGEQAAGAKARPRP